MIKKTIVDHEIKISTTNTVYNSYEKEITQTITEKLFQNYDIGTIIIPNIPPISWTKFYTKIIKINETYFKTEKEFATSKIKAILETTDNMEEFKKIAQKDFFIEKVFIEVIQ